ncbi:MAG: hypothetical protein HZA91_03905, partial [Verrucomicrobia bacterium]|nr:hypothetical protein [Verrucomicrobiota bacterium]
RAPMETAAAAALEELQGLVAASKWEDASSKLAVVSKQFADTATMQCSAERLQDAHDAIVAAEAGPTEARAQLALNKLRQDIENKEWRHAVNMLQTLAKKFAGTDAVEAADDLHTLREMVAAHLPAGTALAEPGARDRVASRKDAKIHQVEAGGKGKLSPAALMAAVAAAKEGDGIEMDGGIYVCKALRSPVKNLSIFGKPGTLPVVLVPSVGRASDGIVVDAPGARWRFENVMFVAGARPGEAPAQPVSPVVVGRGATAEFNHCLFSTVAELARPVSLVRSTGAGGELVLKSCLFLNGSAVEIQTPRRVRLEHCTWTGGPAIWLSEAAPTGQVTEVALVNSLLAGEPLRGVVAGDGQPPETRPLAPAEAAQRLDLSRSHHNVVLVAQQPALDAWKPSLEKQPAGPSFLSLVSDPAPLVVWSDAQQLEFRLQPDCPAAHAADDGKAVGVRWTDAMWDLMKANLRLAVPGRAGGRIAPEPPAR